MLKHTTNNGTFIYHVVAFITVAIWGSTFISTKLLIYAGLSPAHIFTLRFLIAYVLMLTLSLLGLTKGGNRKLLCANMADEACMILLGITGGSAFFLMQNEALRFSTATNVSLIVCSCPLFTMVLMRLLVRGTRLSAWQVLGTLFSFVGMAAVVLNGKFVLHLSPLGDFLALSACLAWAFYSIIMKRMNERYDSIFITRKVFFYGLLTMLPYYIIVPQMPPLEALTRLDVIGHLLFLGVLGSMICFLTWTWVMGKLGAMRATNYIYVNPITTIVFAWLVLHETITPYFIVGTAFILLGLFLSGKSKSA